MASLTKKKIVLIAIGAIAVASSVPLIWVATVVFVAQPVRFLGTSMLPTYRDGDRLMLQKSIGTLTRGDVVCFWYPRDPSKSMIKRVVGLPGETLAIRGGEVYVNGTRIEESYLSPEYCSSVSRDLECAIPAGHVFVLGDNRDHSNDSRQWGTVPIDLVYGKVLFRYG